MGTKYNGLITFALLTFFVPFIYSRYADHTDSNSYRAAKYGIVFAGIALLVFSPWMIRNYIWTNNPIFPLYDHWFNPRYSEAQTSAGPLAYRVLIYHESWWQIVLLPVRIFFQGQDGSPQYFDGKLNPFLSFLPLFAFYQLKKDSQSPGIEKKILLAFACLFLAFAFFSSDLRVRYILPIVPPLIILSVLGIKKIIDIVGDLNKQTAKQIGVFLPLSALTFSLGYNAAYLFDQFVYVEPLSYLKGNVSRDEYISKYRPELPAFQYINEHLPNNALILFIFLGNRGYYCERSYIFDMYENKSKLQQIVENAHDTEGIVSSLQDMGITHLFIHSDIFKRWVKMNFTERMQGLLENFLSRHVKMVYAQWGYDLYALEDLPSS